MPKFLVSPFPKFLEVPPGLNFLWPVNFYRVLGHCCYLDLIDGVAVPHVDHFEGSPDDISAFLSAYFGVPLVGNQSQAKVFGEPSDDVVLLYQSSVEVDAGQNALIILESCDDSVVVVRVEIISFLVADVGEVVHQFLHCILYPIIVQR